jgi:putative ABC transport system permease protein
MQLMQQFRIAIHSIRGNLLRAIITALIITTGISALVGILTAIDGIESSIVKNFSFMGANTFNIENRSSGIRLGRGRKTIRYPKITFKEANTFKERYPQPHMVSVFGNHSWNAIVKYRSAKTNPNTVLTGADQAYLRVAGYELAEGRNINGNDVRNGSMVVVIGQEIKDQLFGTSNPLDQEITIGGGKYRVVGVLAKKGSAFDFGGNRVILLPNTTARKRFYNSNMSYKIGVAVSAVEWLDQAISESIGLFRVVRKNKIKEASNFEIVKSDTISETLLDNLQMIIIAMIVIAIITLIGASVALMNIMLVSVTERIREIGLRKSIGAKKSSILNQFLVEAVTICQVGGLGGIVFGIIIGNLVSNWVGGQFIIPWDWMILSVVVCTVVGVLAGIWPARKAAAVDPIEAMRHE